MSENLAPQPDREWLTHSQRRWELVRQSRFQLADEIDRMAADFQAQVGASLRVVTEWLRGPAEYADALAQPLVLAIGLALTKPVSQRLVPRQPESQCSGIPQDLSPTGEGVVSDSISYTPAEIQQAVRWAVREVIGRQKAASWRIFSLLLYPLLTLLTAWTLWVVASFFLLPSIHEIFDEFGIDLPVITRLLLSSSAIVQQWGVVMVLIPFVYLAVFIGLNHYSSKRSGDRGSWIDRQLAGKRIALAKWAWHLSLLLEWGLASKSAVMIAGMCSRRGWLQHCCQNWIAADRPSPRQTSTLSHASAAGEPLDRVFVRKSRFQLVNHTMSLADGPEKILLLREISTYYQEKSSSFIEWLLAWLSTLLVWFVLGIVGLVLYSIYIPIFQLLGGLTGM